MSGIPNSTCPFPGTTRNIHLFAIFLNLVWTAHMPNCIMCVPLYVFNLMFPFTNHFSSSLPMFANNFQNMYSSIMFPSLPVSILYETSNDVYPACICNFAIMLDHFLFTYTALILTISVSSSWDSASMSISTSWTAWLLLLLHTFLKCPVLPHATHIFPYTGHCLGAWLCP